MPPDQKCKQSWGDNLSFNKHWSELKGKAMLPDATKTQIYMNVVNKSKVTGNVGCHVVNEP